MRHEGSRISFLRHHFFIAIKELSTLTKKIRTRLFFLTLYVKVFSFYFTYKNNRFLTGNWKSQHKIGTEAKLCTISDWFTAVSIPMAREYTCQEHWYKHEMVGLLTWEGCVTDDYCHFVKLYRSWYKTYWWGKHWQILPDLR